MAAEIIQLKILKFGSHFFQQWENPLLFADGFWLIFAKSNIWPLKNHWILTLPHKLCMHDSSSNGASGWVVLSVPKKEKQNHTLIRKHEINILYNYDIHSTEKKRLVTCQSNIPNRLDPISLHSERSWFFLPWYSIIE